MSYNKTQLSETLADELVNFIETHPPEDFSRNLRRIVLDYIRQQVDIGMPIYMKTFLHAVYDLFELLDVAAAETNVACKMKSLF
ncbi:MAG: hypothetical protein ABJA78_15455 [Ferruginibacter sp.]